jgi:pimeloyl-ACP methyl ester carboxylesterase
MIYWSKGVERRVLECYRRILNSWATPHTEHRLSTSQGETFVLSAGDPANPPVILLPGSMATSAMWLRTMDALVSDHYALAVDIIGDAGYSAPSRPRLTSDAHARWLDDVLDRLSLNAAAFVGASFGGLLAADYATRGHDRVERLALLAPGGIVHIRLGAMLRAAPLLFLGPWGHRKALDIDMGFTANDMRSENNDFLELFSLVQSGFVARMQPLPRLSDAALKTLAMPILAVFGSRDSLFDSQAARQRLVTRAPPNKPMRRARTNRSRGHWAPANPDSAESQGAWHRPGAGMCETLTIRVATTFTTGQNLLAFPFHAT